jgi:hypothetical protein
VSSRLDVFVFQLSVTSFQANGQPAMQSHAGTPRHIAPPCSVLQWSKTSIETPNKRLIDASTTPHTRPAPARCREAYVTLCTTDIYVPGALVRVRQPVWVPALAQPRPPHTSHTHSGTWDERTFLPPREVFLRPPPPRRRPPCAHARLTHSPLPAAGSPAQVVAHALRMAGTKREIVCMTVASLPAHAR